MEESSLAGKIGRVCENVEIISDKKVRNEAVHAHLHDVQTDRTDDKYKHRKFHSNERLGWLAPARQLHARVKVFH